MQRLKRLPTWVLNLSLFAIYFVTAKFGLKFDAVSGFASLVWPASGIALSALLLFGFRLWSGIWLAAFLVNILAGAPWITAVGIACGNTLEPVVAAYILQRWCNFHLSLDRRRDVVVFVLFGALFSTLISATIGVGSLWLSGLIPDATVGAAWRAWWVGDILGDLVIVPLILVWAAKEEKPFRVWRVLEALFLMLATFAAGFFIFLGWDVRLGVDGHSFPYLLFPFSVWAPLRFGHRGGVLVTFIISALAIAGTASGSGPFSLGEMHDRLLYLQTFMGIMVLTSLSLGATLAERDAGERRLREKESREAFLNEASAVLASSLDFDTTLATVAYLAVPKIADLCIVDLLEEEDKVRRVEVAYGHPSQQGIAERLKMFPPQKGQQDFVTRSLFRSEIVLIPEINDEVIKGIQRTPAHAQLVREINPKSFMGLPMVARGKVLGVLTFIITSRGKRYRESDLALAKELAARAAMAVDNARLYKQAQEAIEARDEFLSIASHELKTPLTSLLLQNQILRRATKPEENLAPTPQALAKAVNLSRQQLGRLAQLVEDLLDVSRIRAGKLGFRFETVSLGDLVSDVVERFSNELSRVNCLVELQTDSSVVGNWDRARLEQAIVNLLTNAMKYAPGKPIRVTVAWLEDKAILKVKDQGPGVPKEKQDKIFERFERASHAKGVSGLGLGLFITREIVQGHGGSIRLLSEEGAGAEFIIEIPPGVVEKTADVPRESFSEAVNQPQGQTNPEAQI